MTDSDVQEDNYKIYGDIDSDSENEEGIDFIMMCKKCKTSFNIVDKHKCEDKQTFECPCTGCTARIDTEEYNHHWAINNFNGRDQSYKCKSCCGQITGEKIHD